MKPMAGAAVLAAFFFLTACGGSSPDEPAPAPAPPAPAARSAELEIPAADVTTIELSELGIASGSFIISPVPAELQVSIEAGRMAIAAPADTGVEQVFMATFLEPSGANVNLTVRVPASRSISVLSHFDSTEDGPALDASPALSISGLGPGNAILDQPITFTVGGTGSAASAQASSVDIAFPTGTRVALNDVLTVGPTPGVFLLDAAAVRAAAVAAKSDTFSLELNLASDDAEFSAIYAVEAFLPRARIRGTLTDASNVAVTGLAGRRVALLGFNSALRRLTTVAADGSFSFEGVVADTYDLKLIDLQFPNLTSTTVAVFEDDTEVQAVLRFVPQPANAASSTASKAIPAGARPYIAGAFRGNGAPPPSRRTETPNSAAAVDAPGCSTVGEAETTFSVTSAQQGSTIGCAINFSVPKGSTAVQAEIVVSSAEFPVYTQTPGNKYNDTWRYEIFGLGGPLSASGAVNSTHAAAGTLKRKACIDVTTAAQTAGLQIGGTISTTNVGDSAFPTTVTATLKLGCGDELSVTSATFGQKNKVGHTVVKVSAGQNVHGNYVSLPLGGEPSPWGVPLTIRYTPKDADITGLSLAVISGGGIANEQEVSLSGVDLSTPGQIKLRDLVVPTFSLAVPSNKISLAVQLRGTVKGVAKESDGAAPNVEIAGSLAFTPLVFAGNLVNRRYGARDAAGDSWATAKATSWLQGKAYRYDDISALHVARTNAGRSVLGHAGHSDGLQIDLRYADGMGGFTDELGGANEGSMILTMLETARQEVQSNAPNKPQLARAQAWIAANRALFEGVQGDAVVSKVIIGDGWFWRALVDGKFPGEAGLPIPTVTAWAKPDKVRRDVDHRNHWHAYLLP